MSRAHYGPMAEFPALLLQDAFEACRAYFRDVQRLPATTYGLVFWNYMPASGGTQIHPHLQLFATDTPGNALEEELAASARYFASEGRPYWQDLLEAEETLGERFVARRTPTAWLPSVFSARLLADLLGPFPGQAPLPPFPEARPRGVPGKHVSVR